MKDTRPLPLESVSAGPSMLAVIMGINIGAFLLGLFAVPTEFPAGALSIDALQRGEWWTTLTHVFTHANLWHLLSNMLVLFLAGRAVHRYAGAQHFVYIFLASAWAGAVLSLGFRPEATIIGASGGVMGVVGAFVAFYPEYDLMRPVRRYIPLQLKAKHLFPAMMTAFIGLEIATRLLGSDMPRTVSQEAHLVHAGGMLAGWLYGRRLAAEGRFREEWHDFFPQGLRRRSRENLPGALPVAAGFMPELSGEQQSQAGAPAKELSDSEFLHERVDPVLEKLYARGAHQLTDEERAILEEASRRFSRQKR
ncbi:MAG TPA: rhomboid family intramembrane serine protease [Verrucomicrobiales bacterium]|jgi:membrane associated rhomboid family serine protease|nr:rhomboid family intramembrane serine protease [Verrucomicrobiales bacterium]